MSAWDSPYAVRCPVCRAYSRAVSDAAKGSSDGAVSFSAVIPTWNEEDWLPRIVEQLNRACEVGEIIVADNTSDDRTREIALRAGCKVIDGGYPARGRNAGASVATTDYFLFVDADAVLPEGSLRTALAALADGDVGAVHFRLEPLGGSRFVRACYRILELYFRAAARVGIAQGVGPVIAVTRSEYNRVGGFREDLGAGEDIDFLRRVGRGSRVMFVTSIRVGASTRRFVVEHPLSFASKTVIWGVLRLLDVGHELMPYRWQRYPPDLARREAAPVETFLLKSEKGR